MNRYSDSKGSLNITLDDFVVKMSGNSKNSTKSMDAAPPNETKEDNMAEVSKLLQNIQKDLTEVKQDLKMTVIEETLENIVTNIIKKLIAENNKESRTGLGATNAEIFSNLSFLRRFEFFSPNCATK